MRYADVARRLLFPGERFNHAVPQSELFFRKVVQRLAIAAQWK